MAVRATMADLIARVRALCGNAPVEVVLDQMIQDCLDRWRTEMRYVPLLPQPTFAANATIYYYDFYSDIGYWEADVVLQDVSYATITPDVSEYIVGHWHFPSQPNGSAVRATGKTYDVYAAAADVLSLWAGQVALDFDFTSGQDHYTRSQKQTQLLALAAQYRQMAQPHTSKMMQTDAMPDHEGNGVTFSDISGVPYGG